MHEAFRNSVALSSDILNKVFFENTPKSLFVRMILSNEMSPPEKARKEILILIPP